MSKHDFSMDEFESLRGRVRDAMQAQGLDWLVLCHPVSLHWLTGSDAKSYQEFQCLFISAEPAPLVILAREGERNEFEQDALVDQVYSFGGGENEDPIGAFMALGAALGLQRARVGLEVPAYYLHPHHYVRLQEWLGEALVAEPSNLVHDLKLVKSHAELAYIRQASLTADAAMAIFAATLQAGRSELAMAGQVMASLLSANSGLAASPINLVSGERSSFSHGAPTERVLRDGDFGSVEFGATHRRYTATIGRQFSIGQPTPRMQELYALVRSASDACIAKMRDGVPAAEPHAVAKAVIEQAGMGPYRVHTSGYGLGPGFPPSWAEPLHLIGDSTYTLRAGMVVTVEPPIFIGTESLGARLIDNVLITKNGAQLLSRYSRDLIVVADQ
ncbi:MAG: Xaa-Pro peptidase family protein [Burkholderiales bacterium]|nr:Xaa-Pro peptidase family protein [Burkholderiales bacterium]